MVTVLSTGVRLHVQEMGHGARTVVLVHQLLGNMASWYFSLAPALAKEHRVILYDLRGHGLSERPAGGYNLTSMGHDLGAVIDSATDGPVSLVGHSYGAAIALRYVIDNPTRVERLVLVETPLPLDLPQVAEWVLGHQDAAALLNHLPEPQRLAATRVGKRPSRLVRDVLGLVTQTSLTQDIQAERDIDDAGLKTITAAMLFCYGSESPLAGATRTRLEAVLPHARHLNLPGNHNLPFDAPVQLTAAISGFLA